LHTFLYVSRQAKHTKGYVVASGAQTLTQLKEQSVLSNRSFAERFMGMSDDVWSRHANPRSGWSRMTIPPLFALAVWSRDWIGWWSRPCNRVGLRLDMGEPPRIRIARKHAELDVAGGLGREALAGSKPTITSMSITAECP
jgi:hypothetical protein